MISVNDTIDRKTRIKDLIRLLEEEVMHNIYETVVDPMFDLLKEEYPDARHFQVHVKATSKDQVKVNLTSPVAKDQLILPFLNCEVPGDIWTYLEKLCERANEFGLIATKSDTYRLVVFSKNVHN